MATDEPTNRPSKMQARLLLAGLCLIIAAGKIVAFRGSPGPSVFPDENIYRYYARDIFWLEPYISGVDRDPMYPPAYPLALSPAYLVPGDGWFDAMRVINAIISSLLPVAVYLLARHVCPGWPAIAAAAVSAFIPFHTGFCPLLLAENLAVPLFTLAFALALRPGGTGLVRPFVLGLVCGAAFLTKYLFLAYAPFVAAAFIAMQWSASGELPVGRRIAKILKLSGAAMLGAAVLIAAWLWYSLASGNGMANSFGLFLAPTAGKSTPPVEGFWFYLVLLCMGLILLLLLVLPGLFIFYFLPRRKERFNPAARIFGIIFAVMCPLLVLFTARFCWIESLVYLPADRWKIESLSHAIALRYLVYILPLSIPLAAAGLAELCRSTGRFAGRMAGAALAGAATVGLAMLARQILFRGLIWQFPSDVTMSLADSWPNAMDIFVFSMHWGWCVGLAACAAAVCIVAAKSGRAGLVCMVVLAAVAYPSAAAESYGQRWNPQVADRPIRLREFCGSIRSICSEPESTLIVVHCDDAKAIRRSYLFGLYAVFWIDNQINISPGTVRLAGGKVESVKIPADQERLGVQNCRRDKIIDPSGPIKHLLAVMPDGTVFESPPDKLIIHTDRKQN